MSKGLKIFLSLLLSIIFIIPIKAQTTTEDVKRFHPSYDPLPLAKRLSYENFKNIKNLQAAIMNYGGGESEIERLIDQYAEASALYFQNRIEESANMFSDNEREILLVAKKLAEKYKYDAEKLLIQSIKVNIKTTMDRELKGEKPNLVANKCLDNAKFGVLKGNDYYIRYKDASTASPRGLIISIYYYRQAKENLFLMYSVTDMSESKRREILDKYKKDMNDNKNKVYRSMEKEN